MKLFKSPSENTKVDLLSNNVDTVWATSQPHCLLRLHRTHKTPVEEKPTASMERNRTITHRLRTLHEVSAGMLSNSRKNKSQVIKYESRLRLFSGLY